MGMMDIRRAIFNKPTSLPAPVEITGAGQVGFTASKGTKAIHCTSSFKPYQDLHGYDSPYPAGGGINKFDIDNLEQFTVSTVANLKGNKYTTAGTYSIHTYASDSVGVFIYARVKNSDDSWDSTIYVVADTNVYDNVFVTLTEGQELYVYDAISSHTEQESKAVFELWKLQVAISSTQPTQYYPYSNICPIYGWTGEGVWDDPKYCGNINWNQYSPLPTTKQNNTIIPQGTEFIAGHKYLHIFKGSKIGSNNANIYLYFGKNTGVYSAIGVDSYKFFTLETSVTADGTANVGANSVWGYLTTDCNWDSYCLYDLTRMFGAGNEPNSIDAFTALFPKDYYAYNAGTEMTVSQVNGDPYEHVAVEFPTVSANQWNEQWEQGNIDGDGQDKTGSDVIRSKGYIPASPSTSYYVYSGANKRLYMFAYDADKTFIERTNVGTLNWVYTTPANTKYLRFATRDTYGNTYNDDISINLPSSVTTYNPYSNTVFYGEYDLTTGNGTIIEDKVTLTGNEAVQVTDDGMPTMQFSIIINNNMRGQEAVVPIMCSHYKYVKWKDNPWNVDKSVSYYSTAAIRIKDLSYADTTAFKAFLTTQYSNGTPVEICRELTSPIHFHIDPQQFLLLKGSNLMWATMKNGELEATPESLTLKARYITPTTGE